MIVGGGPTGVEVAAELHDLLQDDLKKYYGSLVTEVASVLLIELGDHVLSSYDRAIGEYTSNLFQRYVSLVQHSAQVTAKLCMWRLHVTVGLTQLAELQHYQLGCMACWRTV